MPITKVRGLNPDTLRPLLIERSDFEAGSLVGTALISDPMAGSSLPTAFALAYNREAAAGNIAYTVTSYGAVIAWRTGDGRWVIPGVSWSGETRRHVIVIRTALGV